MTTQARRAHVIRHFLPGNVISEARDLALSFQREELFRRYALKRMWLILPAGLIFLIVGGACAIGTVVFVRQFFQQPVEGRLGTSILIVGLVAWFGAVVAQLYVLFSWLENRALRESMAGASQTAQTAQEFSARPSNNRARSSLWLVAVFVVAPLFALAAASPSIAIILVVVAIFAPIIYTLFDR